MLNHYLEKLIQQLNYSKHFRLHFLKPIILILEC